MEGRFLLLYVQADDGRDLCLRPGPLGSPAEIGSDGTNGFFLAMFGGRCGAEKFKLEGLDIGEENFFAPGRIFVFVGWPGGESEIVVVIEEEASENGATISWIGIDAIIEDCDETGLRFPFKLLGVEGRLERIVRDGAQNGLQAGLKMIARGNCHTSCIQFLFDFCAFDKKGKEKREQNRS